MPGTSGVGQAECILARAGEGETREVAGFGGTGRGFVIGQWSFVIGY
ncbi:hypothetical protein SAMN05421753_113174 [Planctomicrobium piriforme]|uniref:Uncharacterized protein n=1 Tax=Planctomicrobium piriforme TaxID=1576369 RepID=A0A1I3M795_9PLAN|nr:hypothetical protein SAMN05421753_113174 [Planctomicrobium piriforme]